MTDGGIYTLTIEQLLHITGGLLNVILTILLCIQSSSKLYITYKLVENRTSSFFKNRDFIFSLSHAFGGWLLFAIICIREIFKSQFDCRLFYFFGSAFSGLYFLPLFFQSIRTYVIIKTTTRSGGGGGYRGKNYLGNRSLFLAMFVATLLLQISISLIIFDAHRGIHSAHSPGDEPIIEEQVPEYGPHLTTEAREIYNIKQKQFTDDNGENHDKLLSRQLLQADIDGVDQEEPVENPPVVVADADTPPVNEEEVAHDDGDDDEDDNNDNNNQEHQEDEEEEEEIVCFKTIDFFYMIANFFVYFLMFAVTASLNRGIKDHYERQKDTNTCMIIWLIFFPLFFLFNMAFVYKDLPSSIWILFAIFATDYVFFIKPLKKRMIERDIEEQRIDTLYDLIKNGIGQEEILGYVNDDDDKELIKFAFEYHDIYKRYNSSNRNINVNLSYLTSDGMVNLLNFASEQLDGKIKTIITDIINITPISDPSSIGNFHPPSSSTRNGGGGTNGNITEIQMDIMRLNIDRSSIGNISRIKQKHGELIDEMQRYIEDKYSTIIEADEVSALLVRCGEHYAELRAMRDQEIV